MGEAVSRDVAQERRLHQVDGENEHDAGAERGQHGGRLIAGTVEIGQALAQRRRQTQPGAVEQETQRKQRDGGKSQQHASTAARPIPNHAPTQTESESAQAMPPSARTTSRGDAELQPARRPAR